MTLDSAPRVSVLMLFAAMAAGLPANGSGQTAAEVPRFEIASSPIELTGPVRPGEYLGVTGPRSAWLGLETGEAELWVHPLKVGNRFRLGFSTPAYGAPIPGSAVARTVHVRPELTTIAYSHAAFQVRQHILAPAELPGLLVLLEVDSPEPLEIIAEFEPVLNYMWPGSLGGQYAYWDGGRRAFVLSESLQETNAVVGSPWAVNSVEHPAHQLGEAPRTMVIPVEPERARREFIPIAVAGGTMPREEVFASYDRLIAEAHSLYGAKRAWADSVLASTVSIESPDPQLDLALEWAKINLEEQRVCNPDLGCGFVAGWGLSRNGTRPGFGWFFGGDAAQTTFAMDVLGQWGVVAEELAFLARYQREDGKITHEISQAAARIPWFEVYPYAYYHADTTPYWMVALYEYWRASGDDELLRELWPAYRRAWEWCLGAETDGDGIIENTVGGLAAVEVGGLGAALHQDVYLAGVWTAALEGTAALAERMGEPGMANRAREMAPRARKTLNDAYWLEEAGHHAFGILADGGTNDNLTVWPATAAAFGLFDEARGRSTLARLASDRISSDWGAHMLSTESELYHPLQYNMGSVWPFVTAYVSWAQYRYRRPWAGFHLVDAVKQMTFDWSLGRHPELLSGTFYQPLDQTVPHQFFATSALVTPLLRGVIGWEPDAPLDRVRLAPQLPPDWPAVTVRRLRAGETATDVEIRQRWTAEGGERRTTLTTTGPALTFAFVPDVPAGARDVSIGVNGAVTELTEDGTVEVTLGETVAAGDRAEIVVTWGGGLAIAPPRIDLEPGQVSSGLRILDFNADPDGWLLEVEGLAGRSYDLGLFGATVEADVVQGAATTALANPATVRIAFPPDTAERTTAVVRFTTP
ncbi:GH116 family glycosyl hydrolase [Candidatus Palauibacter polyketidifaciens]|uniref:amylo-alpha-1,6-glucosidase n=1 Tax=Candidatus Palauibacter polyketidifaciens TaxID=3056740 RepID=UPI00239B5B3A|nr:GH116 family glycosyl hydrolase [Candidatus Palauibacter polyketidifaciens]MDE2719222.1 GH116 family glycosyl hydrolase [Candidatus Palauibacter polyketidifaciens]